MKLVKKTILEVTYTVELNEKEVDILIHALDKYHEFATINPSSYGGKNVSLIKNLVNELVDTIANGF